MKTRSRGRAAILALAAAVVLMVLVAVPAQAARNSNPRVIPPQAMPFGMSYGDWGAKWWQWVLAIPQDQNPCFDFTGANAAVGQRGKVWFLAGTMEPDWTGAMNAERTCTVPVGKAIFVPVVNAEMSPPEGPGMAWVDLVAFASSFIDDVTLAELTVDGRTVQVADYRTHTDPDDPPSYTMPENGVLAPAGVAPGTYPFFADGYCAMLAPLSAGRHTVKIHGIAEGSWGLFETQVVYHLTVK